MKDPCVSKATLHVHEARRNKYTVDAIKPAGFDSCHIPESDILALINHTTQLRPFRRQLDFHLTGEVASEAILAAVRCSDGTFRDCDLARLKRLAWPIACRRQARELQARSLAVVHVDLEVFADLSSETPFRQVETACALDAATCNLIDAGIPADGISAVVLHFLGWSPTQIAEFFGQKVEAVRKRIYRLSGQVRKELQVQFSMEVA